MPSLNVTFTVDALPEGWSGTPQEFADLLASRMKAAISGAFLTGQIGGSLPTTNVGIYFDDATRIVYMWDEELSKYLPLKADVPVGSMTVWAGGSAPSDENWLLCQGQELAVADYPALFVILGLTYIITADSGSGTHFRLPDLRGRVPVGAGTGDYQNPRTDHIRAHSLGDQFGAEWQEPYPGDPGFPASPNYRGAYLAQLLYDVTRVSQPPTVQPPSLAVNWIIKAK